MPRYFAITAQGICTQPIADSDLAAFLANEQGVVGLIEVSEDVAVNGGPTPQSFITAQQNLAALTVKAQTALDSNQTFLAIASPTNAQTLAQVKALTRECSALIRILLGLLDTTTGT